MSRGVHFSEAVGQLEDETDPASDPAGNETPGATQLKQFNKFSLLGPIEGLESVDSSNSDNDEKLVDDSDGDRIVSDSKPSSHQSARTADGGRQKSRRKRGKKKSKNKNKDLEDLENEVDYLTKAIVLHSSANQKRDENARFKMLKVDTKNLIPEAEIKRMFGKSVIKDDKSIKLRQHPGSNLQRSRFVSSSYFEMRSTRNFTGPRMELDQEVNDERRRDLQHTTGHRAEEHDKAQQESSSFFGSDEPIYFKFVHDRAYQEAQRVFLFEVNRGNAESIVQNLTIAPFHVESLVQLSHMIRVSEDYKTASEMIERAIVMFEKGFHPRFNIATATCRLSYKRPENRTFFITIFKHIIHCHRRGLRRTPFEYTKFLLSLEPENDPLQAVQMMDFFALRSEEYDYLIEFYKKWDRLQKMPNFSYSVALAHFLKSQSSKLNREESLKNLAWAEEFLQKALIVFPNFIVSLLNACSGEPNEELKKCAYFDYTVYGTNYKLVPETVEVLVNLYVKRSYIIWKQKPVMSWLEKNVETMVNKFKSGELIDERRHIEHWNAFPKVVPKNLLRHIVLCDLDMKVPPSASSSTFLDMDPYPPTDSIISYDSNLQSSNQGGSTESEGSLIGNLGGLFLRSFLPSFSMNEQQQQQQQQQQRSDRSVNPASEQRPQRTRGRQQDVNRAANSNGSQITIEDYIIDDDDTLQPDGPLNNHQSDMQSIRDLASTVTNLLGLESSRQSQSQDADGGRNGPSDQNDDSARENTDRRTP